MPYLLTTLLYASVALLVAADAALVSLGLVSPFTALRWVRVHFITLGIISQVIFGVLPARGVLYGIGFIFYTLALIHPLKELAQIARTVLGKLESA